MTPHRRVRALTAVIGSAALGAGLVTAVVPPVAASVATPAAASVVADAVPGPGAPPGVWEQVDRRVHRSQDGRPRRVAPREYGSYLLDLDTLGSRLERAPLEGAGGRPVTIAVPSPSGQLVEFAVSESPVMEPGLAAEYPGIATYAGRATGAEPASIRLDVTPTGFHASVRGEGAAWYVDPAYNGVGQGDDALYLSYRGDDLPAPEQSFVEPELRDLDPATAGALRRAARPGRTAPSVGEGPGAPAVQRTYRLALVTDYTYSGFFAPDATTDAEANPIITAEKTTLVNRINHIYGDDLSIRLLLVEETDKTNFNTLSSMVVGNGRCGTLACYSSSMLDEGCYDPALMPRTRLVLGQTVGAEDYDVGHLGLGVDISGGIARLGAVGTVNKWDGCTALPTPDGDSYAVDYVAHEIGHQLGANHTFASSTCADQGNPATAVEPGSGSSVMAYAGVCGVDDLQPHTDPYLSQRSQTEIAAYTRSSLPPVAEVQNIALKDFGVNEGFTLTYGAGPSTLVQNGSGKNNYTAAGLKAAIEAAEPSPSTVTVTGLWGATGLGNGFQVTWNGTPGVPTPTLSVTSGSFTSIVGTTDNGGPAANGGSASTSGNRNPVVTAPAPRTIPMRTPFQLTGSATDPDGDPLTYLWEQNDPGPAGGTALNSNTKPSGPLFRQFGTYADVTEAGTLTYGSPGENAASTSPTRSFPDLEQVIAGTTNAGSGACPVYNGSSAIPPGGVLDCYSEYLPTSARTLDFRLTARDLGGPDGGSDGGTSAADVALTVSDLGPFLVTSQRSTTAVIGGTAGTVTWSTGMSSLAADVRILFSTDGGRTYPHVLLATTPNDGTQAVTWPNVATMQGRIKVEAVDNYFYDLNEASIVVTSSGPVATLSVGGTAPGGTFTTASSDPLPSTPTITASASAVDGSAITLSATGLPTGLAFVRQPPPATSAAGVRPGVTQFDLVSPPDGGVDADPGTYPVTATVSDGPGNATDQVVALTVVVTKDSATLTYDGDTERVADQGGAGAVDVTVAVTLADLDGTAGTIDGTVAFTDQTTGQTLCTTTVVAGRASCTFGADLDGTNSRTYQVVATLTGPRYTGSSGPTAVLVRYEAATGLVVTGPSPAAPASQYSDVSTADFAVRSQEVASQDFEVAPTAPLPGGFSLARTDGTDAVPGNATVTLTADATVAPGTYPITLSFSDGTNPSTTRTVTFTVAPELATAAYSGPTQVTTTVRGPDAVTVALTGTVSQEPDGSDGDLTLASAAFVDTLTGATLCTSPVDAGGAVGCSFGADVPATGDGHYQVAIEVGDPFAGGTATATALDVLVDDGLVVAGPLTGDAPSTQYSDPRSVTFDVTSRFTASDTFAAITSPSPLPADFTLTRTPPSGELPGAATYTLRTSGELAPGTYPLAVTFGDGGTHAPVTREVTFTVVPEQSSVTYTGPTQVTAPAGASSTSFDLTAQVASAVGPDDTTPGAISVSTVTFTDAATGETLCADAEVTQTADGVGTATCTVTAALPADDGRVYRVALAVGDHYTGAASATSVTLTQQPGVPVDTTPPQTAITTGPAEGAYALTKAVALGYTSTEKGGTFRCRLVGFSGVVPCPATGRTSLSNLPGGSYRLQVWAKDAAGNEDATPATRTFHVPVDDRALKRKSGTWKQGTASTAFRGTYRTIARKGGSLTLAVAGATSLALVVEKGPRYGTLEVFLGSKKLRTVKTAGSRVRPLQVVVLAKGTALLKGTLRIVSTSNAQVRVDAVGVVKPVPAARTAPPRVGRVPL